MLHTLYEQGLRHGVDYFNEWVTLSLLHDGQRCLTHSLWDDLSQQIFIFLTDITLADLVQRGQEREAERREKRAAANRVLGLKEQAA